jgi:simple sugar transport system ATP-binding protein
VLVAGEAVAHPTARRMLDAGVGHIPEDRQRRGLVLEFSIAENIALHDYNRQPDSRFGWLFPRRLVQRARALIKEFDVRGGGRRREPARSPAATSRSSSPRARSLATRRC